MPDPSPPELVAFQHPTLDFRVGLPPFFQARADVRGVALIAALPPDPEEPSRFRANLNVVVEQPPTPLEDLDAYQRTSWETAERELDRLELWDREETHVGGEPCVRVLAHYLAGDWALVLEQWRFVRRGRGWVVTATMLPVDLPRLQPIFVDVVDSLELGPDA